MVWKVMEYVKILTLVYYHSGFDYRGCYRYDKFNIIAETYITLYNVIYVSDNR